MHVTRMVPIYLACFSIPCDDEGQWRSYGRNGAGVCLGIRTGLPEKPINLGFGEGLLKVPYDEATWRAEMAKAMRHRRPGVDSDEPQAHCDARGEQELRGHGSGGSPRHGKGALGRARLYAARDCV